MASTKMSNFTILPNEACRDKNLTPYERSVLGYLHSLHPCYPSYEDIGAATGISRSKVSEILHDLKAQGVITWVQGNSKGFNNEYTIRPSSEWRLVPKKAKPSKIRKSMRKRGQSANPPIQQGYPLTVNQCPTPQTGGSPHSNTPIILNNNIKEKSSQNEDTEDKANHEMNEIPTTNPLVHADDQSSMQGFSEVVSSFGAKHESTIAYFKELVRTSKQLNLIEIRDILKADDIQSYWPEGMQYYLDIYKQTKEIAEKNP